MRLGRVIGLTGGTVVMGLCFRFCFCKWVSSVSIFQIVFLFVDCMVFCHFTVLLLGVLPASVMYEYWPGALTRKRVGSRRVTALNRLIDGLFFGNFVCFWGIIIMGSLFFRNFCWCLV